MESEVKQHKASEIMISRRRLSSRPLHQLGTVHLEGQLWVVSGHSSTAASLHGGLSQPAASAQCSLTWLRLLLLEHTKSARLII